MAKRRSVVLSAAVTSLALAAAPLAAAAPGVAARHSADHTPTKYELIAQQDAANLDAAAQAIQAQALASGALTEPTKYVKPAKILFTSAMALIEQARATDPTLQPADTTAVMGPVPYAISHHYKKRPHHHRVPTTQALSPFVAAVPDSGSDGAGLHKKHSGVKPAPLQQPDGVYVTPAVPKPDKMTISEVAIRTALRNLGAPYVWAAAGPVAYDCSGLVQWAYAHAGISLTHYTGAQWNQGKLIPGKDLLPGDLILFGKQISHVGMYLGAGWMINAPYTGHYVDVSPVYGDVMGVVRP